MPTKSEIEMHEVGNNKDGNKRQRQMRRRKDTAVESSPKGLSGRRGCFSKFLLHYPHSFIT